MIQQTLFKERLRESLQRETLHSRSVKIAQHANVYTCGDQDDTVYFIENGQIKLLMLSSEGKECLLAIHSAGDLFGELCLCGSGSRLETATAMEETILKKIPSSQFLARLVGTTRPRISLFMQRFRNLGLIEPNLDRFLVINEKKLTDYLAQIAVAPGHHRRSRDDSFQYRPIKQRHFPKLAGRHVESTGR